MKIKISLLMALAMSCLTACAGIARIDSSSKSVSSSYSAVPSSTEISASSVSASTAESCASDTIQNTETQFINEKLFSFIGKPLSALKDEFGEGYFIYEVGSSTGALEYYEPYIRFYFDPSNYFNNSGLPQHDSEQDPFKRDDLIIKYFMLTSNYDSASDSIVNQSSLNQLFLTNEKVTYSLLNEKLQLTPAIEHNPDGQYVEIKEFEISSKFSPVSGGTYNAIYTINDFPVEITFVKENEEYVALYAVMHQL